MTGRELLRGSDIIGRSGRHSGNVRREKRSKYKAGRQKIKKQKLGNKKKKSWATKIKQKLGNKDDNNKIGARK